MKIRLRLVNELVGFITRPIAAVWKKTDAVFTKRLGSDWLNRFLNSTWFDLMVFVFSLPFAYASRLGKWELLSVYLLLVGQNVSFTWVSRARQTRSLFLHRMMSVLSNGFYIFVVTAYVAYYKNTPMKLVYVAGTIIGASLGHRSAIWLEAQRTFAKDAVITKAELTGQLILDFDVFYRAKVSPLEGRIVTVYSRMLRKLRSEMEWVRKTFATKDELNQLRLNFESRLTELNSPRLVISDAQRERNAIIRELMPNISKTNRGRKWHTFERAGQLRLGL